MRLKPERYVSIPFIILSRNPYTSLSFIDPTFFTYYPTDHDHNQLQHRAGSHSAGQ